MVTTAVAVGAALLLLLLRSSVTTPSELLLLLEPGLWRAANRAFYKTFNNFRLCSLVA